jgi:hypothetical protein
MQVGDCPGWDACLTEAQSAQLAVYLSKSSAWVRAAETCITGQAPP